MSEMKSATERLLNLPWQAPPPLADIERRVEKRAQRRRATKGAGVALLSSVVLGAGIWFAAIPHSHRSLSRASGPRSSPTSQRIALLGAPPTGFVGGAGAVFVVGLPPGQRSGGLVLRIDAATGRVTKDASLAGGGFGPPLLVGSNIWLSELSDSRWKVLELRATDLKVLHELSLPIIGSVKLQKPPTIAFGARRVWVADGPDLYALSLQDSLVRRIGLEPSGTSSVASNSDGTRLAISLSDNQVEIMNPSNGAIVRRFGALPDNATQVDTLIGNRAWVTEYQANATGFASVDVTTGNVYQLPVGGNGAQLVPAPPDGVIETDPLVTGSNCIDGVDGRVLFRIASVNRGELVVGAGRRWLYGVRPYHQEFILQRGSFRGC